MKLRVKAIDSRQRLRSLAPWGTQKGAHPRGQRAASLRKELLGGNEKTNLAALRLREWRVIRLKRRTGNRSWREVTSK